MLAAILTGQCVQFAHEVDSDDPDFGERHFNAECPDKVQAEFLALCASLKLPFETQIV